MAGPIVVPSRCTANLPEDLALPHLVCEPKLDGSRFMLYLGRGVDPYDRSPLNALLSRRVSTVDGKHVDRTGNVPHVTGHHYEGLDGTVLDGEAFLTDFPTTQSIMGSGPTTAVSKQATVGRIVFYVWDCPIFRGVDIRGRSLRERRLALEEVVRRMNNPDVRAVPQWRGSDAMMHFFQITAAGGEGLIVKDDRVGYGVGWSKMKKSYEISCIVTGFKPGHGKYADTVGAIALSVLDANALVEVGFASGFDDETRRAIGADFARFDRRVVDVYAQDVSKDGRLRHPTFYRWRDDLSPVGITMDKLKADLKMAAKNKRWRE